VKIGRAASASGATQKCARDESACAKSLTLDSVPGCKLCVVSHPRSRSDTVGPSPGQPLLRIGEVARRTGVSVDTIRHYEGLGLLPTAARTAGGFRQYPTVVLTRVEVVRAALALGFSLRELTSVLRERERGGRPCAEVAALLSAKLQTLDEELARLRRLRGVLLAIAADWKDRLARSGPTERAGLLDALAHAAAPASRDTLKRRLPSSWPAAARPTRGAA
jgi:MerR family transcriptional regulator, copper efflux regulator